MNSGQALIILGMHRSGTSMLTGLLSQVGVQMGKSLYKPQAGVNEKGFWEHEDIVDTHDELLLALHSQWDDLFALPDQWWESEISQYYQDKLIQFVQRDFQDAPLWALKDPRMCRLLPLWLSIFDAQTIEPRFICLNRNPLEVAASLVKRDGFSEQKALILWLMHTLLAERYSRDYPRIFIDFDQVVARPLETLQQIEQALEIKFPVAIQQAEQAVQSFVSPELRHHCLDLSDTEQTKLTKLALRLYQLTSEIAHGQVVDCSLIDAIANEFLDYQRQFWPAELVEQIRYLNDERADYRIKFFQIYRSWSWLFVKPLWMVERFIRGY